LDYPNHSLVCLPRTGYYVSHNRLIEISQSAHQRLQWLKTWQRLRAEGLSAQKAADILRLPRSTLYRWLKRLDKRGLRGLEDGDPTKASAQTAVESGAG
jgi:DNA-binding IclR family transcriptional regulator